MKAMQRSHLSMAMAASLMGFGAASVTPESVLAQEVSTSNTGQALIYPYYTVNGGWITTLNLINTSEKTLAVKVRFHELKNSRDVLDFVIVMSPFDTWSGWVEEGTSGPTVRTVDNSCTSPTVIDGQGLSSIAYTGDSDDTGGTGLNRMREGYVEVLVMGVADEIEEPPTDPEFDADENFDNLDTLYVPYHAEHVDGEPRDCTTVDRAFIAQTGQWQPGDTPANLPTAFGDPGLTCEDNDGLDGSGYPLAVCDFTAPMDGEDNPLKGNVGWLNASTGFGAGSEAIAVEDWATGAEGTFVTAQQYPWFLEPTFATAESLWSMSQEQLEKFEATISAEATMNEWADNPSNGARSDWVVTFPTKAFHVDIFNDQIQAASNKYRNDMSPVVTDLDAGADEPCEEDRTNCEPTDTPITVAPFVYGFGIEGLDPIDERGDSKIEVKFTFYDREEGSVEVTTDGTTISPAPPVEIEVSTMKYEANVIQFSNQSVLGSNFPAVQSASALLDGAPSGWANLEFLEPGSPVNNPVLQALPVTAFAIRAIDRTQDGQAYDAGYVRPDDEMAE
mgnify:CR=1 FL=1